jgi:hypothetical protein
LGKSSSLKFIWPKLNIFIFIINAQKAHQWSISCLHWAHF